MQVLGVRVRCVGRKTIHSVLPVEAVEVKEGTGVAEAEADQEAGVAGDPVEAGGDGHHGGRGLIGVRRV